MRVNARTVASCLVALLSVASVAGAAGDHRLADAVKNRDKEAVRTLLSQRVDVNAPQPDGGTALHWAAHWDDVETANLLLRAGAKVDAANDYRITPLALACTNGSAPMIATFLKAGANPNAVFPTGETALMTAAGTGKVDAVKVLLAAGTDPNATEPAKGQTALMWAAVDGYADVARALIAGGASVQARSKDGYTPFLFAARSGDQQTRQVLLDAGASVNEAAANGMTALVIATIRGNRPLAEFLLKQGADANAGPGFTALHWASGDWGSVVKAEDTEWSTLGGLRGQDRLAFVKLLLEHGANPNARAESNPRVEPGMRRGGDLVGATPFLIAAKATALDVMQLLLASGADPLLGTADKTTPLMLAAGVGHNTPSPETEAARALEAVKLCLETGADVNAVNANGETALHGAVYRGAEAIVELLAERGANLDVTNKKGWTPLVIAEGIAFPATNTRSAGTTAALQKRGAAPSPPDVNRSSTAEIAAPPAVAPAR